jgi:hypothetical protein
MNTLFRKSFPLSKREDKVVGDGVNSLSMVKLLIYY